MSPRIVSISDDGRTKTERRSWLGPHFHSVYPRDFCYVCEREGADSEDHVIAEGFFAGTAAEIPRLLAHKGWNNAYSEAEEYVRNVLGQFDAATGYTCEAVRAKVLAALKPEHPIPRALQKWEQQRRET